MPVMTAGPYGYVRHPRYLGLIVSRTATPLTFASIIGWALLVAWIAVVLRRIRLEELPLQRSFGESYHNYSRLRARLIPGLY
jgi:protein-S-isoprenylcysteine O-methyltransferase Ste14